LSLSVKFGIFMELESLVMRPGILIFKYRGYTDLKHCRDDIIVYLYVYLY